ncbi:unnamed protein product [Arabidopsis lyrata]|nr:unnamed protein product [Arabidopsis lyrata]
MSSTQTDENQESNNRLDTLKKQYEVYRKITFGSTGLGTNQRTGSLDAPDHWWKDKIKAYPEAAKLRSHPLRFIPLLDVVFRDETVVVEESWQPRRGVYRRAPIMDLSDNEWVNNNGEDKREVIFMASQPNLLASTSKTRSHMLYFNGLLWRNKRKKPKKNPKSDF